MGSNPFLERFYPKLRGKHGLKSEKKTARRLAGWLRPGSGAVEGAKGDILLSTYLLENKCTENASLSIKLAWLEKISKEARGENRTPGLSLQFVDKLGNPMPFGRWVLIPEDEFKEMQE